VEDTTSAEIAMLNPV